MTGWFDERLLLVSAGRVTPTGGRAGGGYDGRMRRDHVQNAGV